MTLKRIFINNIMNLKKGDIILIPFPYTNLTDVKLRPALVIYVDNDWEDLIILAITSKQSRYKEIMITNADLGEGTLPIDSYIRYTKIATLHNSLVKKKVAYLKSQILNIILEKLKQELTD